MITPKGPSRTLLALTLTLISLAAQTPPIAIGVSHVIWEYDTNELAIIQNFIVKAGNAVTNRSTFAKSTNAPMTFMTGMPNGLYNLNVVAVSVEGLQSEPSTNLVFLWLGSKPSQANGLKLSK